MALQQKRKLTLRVNEHLIERAKLYAAQHNISVSELIEVFFVRLDETTADANTPLVQLLTGLIPDEVDVVQMYGDYLIEKHGQRLTMLWFGKHWRGAGRTSRMPC